MQSSPATYRSGRQKLLIIGSTLGGIIVLAIGSYVLFGGHKVPPPTHTAYPTGGRGQALTPVVWRPAPLKTPETKVKEQFTGARGGTAVADPALIAAINVKNEGAWQTFIKQPEHQQMASAGGEGVEDGEENALSQSLKRSNLGPKSVGRIDRNYLYEISAGRTLLCNTTKNINTQLQGFVTCDIQGDVLNDSNSAMLLRNGTHVFGQIKSSMVSGTTRTNILWTEIRTDDAPACKIAINSPAADQLGAAGMPVVTDTHFWDVFWATAVYTALQAAPALGIAAMQNSSGNNNNFFPYYQLANPTESMGSRMLQQRMNQPPTGEAHLGSPLTIVVGTDIDVHKCVHFDFARSAR